MNEEAAPGGIGVIKLSDEERALYCSSEISSHPGE
jgi:hypothetical protein